MMIATDSNERRASDRYADLLGQFGKGWEKGKAAMIGEVFADDAAFQASPFDQPLRGRAAIEEYWKDTPQEQAEISFRIGEIFVAGPWFSAEFKCTFRRRRTGEWVDIRGALFCETAGDKLTEMRMYWHRSEISRMG